MTPAEAWAGGNAHVWAYDSDDDESIVVESIEGVVGPHKLSPRSTAKKEVEGLTSVSTTVPGQASAPRGIRQLRTLFDSMDREGRGSIDRFDILDALKNNPRPRPHSRA